MKATTISPLDHLLERFCAPEHELRKAMHRPHLHNGKVYASDSMVGVEIPANLLDGDYQPREGYPDLPSIIDEYAGKDVIDQLNVSAIRRALLQVPEDDWIAACEHCGGEGSFMCPCCQSVSDCMNCHGDGEVENHVLCKLNRWYFDARNMELLADLADCLEARTLDLTSTPDDDTRSINYGALAGRIGPVRFAIMNTSDEYCHDIAEIDFNLARS